MKKEILLLTIGLNFYTASSFGASYDTLPKDIDVLVLKQVITSKIESRFDANNKDDSFTLKENFNSSRLENISSTIKSYFQELKNISPDAYNQLSLGEFSANAYAQVNAQGLGLARGMTDHLTIYGTLPIYHLKTNISFKKSKKSNLAAIQAAISNIPTSTGSSTLIKEITLQIPETSEQLMQSLIVNYYKYKPLGLWEKDALGDAEIGAMYRLTDFYDKGFAMAGGFVLPTGQSDDPDSLQDIPTGEGQVDAFVESMAGISFFDKTLQFDLKNRFTYQFAANKRFRTSEDPNFPLSKTSEILNEKLGNKKDTTLTVTYNTTSWLNFNSSYIYNEIDNSKYESNIPNINKVLEMNSLSTNEWLRVGVGLSSLELYKTKKMDIPCELNVSAQKLMKGTNSARYTRLDLDFRLYF